MKVKCQVSNVKCQVSSVKCQKGQVMIIALVFLAVVLIIASSLFTRVADFIRFGSNSVMKEQATQLADAGIDYAVQRLNDLAGAYPDLDGEGTDTQTLPTGQVAIEVENKSQNLKTITATGYIPNSTNPRAKRTVKVDVYSGQGTSFRYAVQVGSEGVDMSQSSTINGNVYSNGNITAGNGNQQTIDGEAWAAGTIASPPISVTKLPLHPLASPEPLPDINQIVDDAKTAATAGGIIDCTDTPTECTISTSRNIGPNQYINGNLTITNNITVTMKGPIWVEGNSYTFSMSQGNTILKLDNGFASNNVVLLVDGTINLTQGGSLQPTNGTPPGYIMLVSNSSSSQAIQISQSGTTAIFYALAGGAELSQSANVTSLVANKLTMTQSSTLTYDTGLANANFTTGPGGSWQVKKGTYKYTSSP